MLTVAIVGASGYTGLELIRILYRHPEVALTCLTSEQSAGRKISDIFPTLRGRCDLTLENLEPVSVAAKADLIFTALPHKAAMEVVPTFLKLGRHVIDLSADYRLSDPQVYGAWYEPHLNPANLKKAVYGLPEIRRTRIKGARLVANPGCYPTSIILALAPLLKKKLIDTAGIIADSASGVTGAGRAAKVDSLYCEVNEGFRAYGVGGRPSPYAGDRAGAVAAGGRRAAHHLHPPPGADGSRHPLHGLCTAAQGYHYRETGQTLPGVLPR